MCEAAICQDDPAVDYKNESIWYAGERICQKCPFLKFQKKQADINKWFKRGKFKNTEIPYTANDLETKLI